MVSTPVFRLNILPSNYDAAAIESSDEFGALETALQTVQQYDTRIAALEDVADGLGDASTYGVANDLTQQTAGENVLDAAQGKALGDRLTTAEGDIVSLNDGLANLIKRVTITGTTSSAGVYPTEYSFNRVISAHPVTGTTAYLAIRETASHKAAVFAYTSSGGSLTSVNNTDITFELIYI